MLWRHSFGGWENKVIQEFKGNPLYISGGRRASLWLVRGLVNVAQYCLPLGGICGGQRKPVEQVLKASFCDRLMGTDLKPSSSTMFWPQLIQTSTPVHPFFRVCERTHIHYNAWRRLEGNSLVFCRQSKKELVEFTDPHVLNELSKFILGPG